LERQRQWPLLQGLQLLRFSRDDPQREWRRRQVGGAPQLLFQILFARRKSRRLDPAANRKLQVLRAAMNRIMSLLEAALRYAIEGRAVFPCLPRDKNPLPRSRGFKDATSNPAAIRRFWRAADRNIGIATGVISGFWILDIDPGGEDHIRRLEAEHGTLPPTRQVRTGRLGRHLWFKYTEPIQCSQSRVAPHIDVKGDGGYGIGVPSVHENGRRYEWITDPSTPLAIAPEWLVALTRKKPAISERARVRPRSRVCSSHAYGAAALNAEAAALSAALPGARNHALNRAAFALYQLVAGGELDAGAVEACLIRACEANGLIADDGLHSVEKTIRSGRNAGLQYPRSRSGRLT
jgi:hypothetical protein